MTVVFYAYREKDITEDKFLPPYAAVELAQLKLKIDDLEGAMKYCNKAMYVSVLVGLNLIHVGLHNRRLTVIVAAV